MQLEMAHFAPGAATWRTGRNTHVIFDSGTFTPLCENMTSSTKPKDVLHRRQRRTEPWQRATCTLYKKFDQI